MLQKIVNTFVYWVGVVTLVIVALIAGIAFSIFGGKKKADDSAKPKAAQVVVMEDKKPEAVALVSASANDEAKSDGTASSSCLCADDVTCKGPRGGTYCIREDGKKRYR